METNMTTMTEETSERLAKLFFNLLGRPDSFKNLATITHWARQIEPKFKRDGFEHVRLVMRWAFESDFWGPKLKMVKRVDPLTYFIQKYDTMDARRVGELKTAEVQEAKHKPTQMGHEFNQAKVFDTCCECGKTFETKDNNVRCDACLIKWDVEWKAKYGRDYHEPRPHGWHYQLYGRICPTCGVGPTVGCTCPETAYVMRSHSST